MQLRSSVPTSEYRPVSTAISGPDQVLQWVLMLVSDTGVKPEDTSSSTAMSGIGGIVTVVCSSLSVRRDDHVNAEDTGCCNDRVLVLHVAS